MIKNKKYDVAIIGRNCIDYIFLIDDYPKENSKKIIIKRIVEAGGQGSTAACCISKLGGKVAFWVNLGNDAEGRFCLKRLKDFNVDIDNVKICKKYKTPTAYIFVNSNNGARTIFFEKCTLPKLNIKQISKEIISSVKVVLLDPETTHLAKDLKKYLNRDSKIVYDCERWINGIEYLYNVADYFIPSYEFFESDKIFSPQDTFLNKVSKLKKNIKNELIITRGENGAYFVLDDALYNVPAPKIKVLDTIGAGDNFHAAFSFAISKSFDLTSAVKFSVAVASISCKKYGGREGIPSFKYAINQAKKLKTIFVSKI